MDYTITTLDGVFWDKQELLSQMMDDKFYYNYLGQNALSSSACKKLLESPLAYKNSLGGNSSNNNQALRDGWLFHCRVLEPEKYDKLHFVDVQSKNSKAYKLAVEEHGQAFTENEKYNAEQMASVFLNNSKTRDLLSNTRSEVPAIGEIDGLPFRAKADILGGKFIVDLKTTGKGGLQKFKWSADNFGYDVQCYIYCELFGISYKDFTFAVIEKETHLMGLFECSKEFYERGRYKTEEAIQIYRDFFLEKRKPVEEFYLYDVL
jgi:hypothetical protein